MLLNNVNMDNYLISAYNNVLFTIAMNVLSPKWYFRVVGEREDKRIQRGISNYRHKEIKISVEVLNNNCEIGWNGEG